PGNMLYSQDSSPQEQFRTARQLAFNQETEKARALCYDLLSQKPDHHDARVLIGRTLAWDQMYDSARTELKKVYQQMPRHYDCLNTLIDLERWSNNLTTSLQYTNRGLEFYPNDEQFLYKKAEILNRLEQTGKAVQTLNLLLSINPAHEQGNKLHGQLKPGILKEAGVTHYFDFFKKPWIKRWHIVALQGKLNFENTPLIARINYGKLIHSGASYSRSNNFQYRVDAYPRITPSDYLFINFAYSGSGLFPKIQYAGEWFHNFNRGFEASAGFRRMTWAEPLLFYTASVGKYYRNYWFSLRTFVTPNEKTTGQSYMLSARRYLATSKDYLGLKLQYGTSPENPSYLMDLPEIVRLKTLGFRFTYQKNWKNWLLRLGLGYQNQEYEENTTRDNINTEIRLIYQFIN
ncbi:MAG: YaiO family outer membrane beta-barrel protein, partial [Bacteroidales bacterium]|nr:YaiO family outer membrane beta-barrel protein [Bacteroidales bacterium]